MAKAYFPKNKEYKGNHPLEYRDHYEGLLEEVGLIEMVINKVYVKNGMLVIEYYPQ